MTLADFELLQDTEIDFKGEVLQSSMMADSDDDGEDVML